MYITFLQPGICFLDAGLFCTIYDLQHLLLLLYVVTVIGQYLPIFSSLQPITNKKIEHPITFQILLKYHNLSTF